MPVLPDRGYEGNGPDSIAMYCATNNNGFKLPEAIRTPLERSFATDLGALVVHVGRQAETIGAVAFAYGDEVYVSEQVWNGSPDTRLKVIAHECAHVIQQRQGRVKATTWYNGIGLSLEPDLEAEAVAAAERAARGLPVDLVQKAPIRGKTAPVAQPLISVHGELVKFSLKASPGQPTTVLTNLSARFVKILKLIAGSYAWLDWAANKTTRTYVARNELALLLEILEGLHNSSLLRLPDIPLVVSPARLWEMPDDDFETLVAASPSTQPQVQAVLEAHGLQPQNTLDDALEYFQNLSGSQPTLWANATLGDEIALEKVYLTLTNDRVPKVVVNNLVNFAQLTASDPAEFADCCNFYLALWQQGGSPAASSDNKTLAGSAASVWEEIGAFAVRYLNSPSFGTAWRGSDLHSLIRNWIETGGEVGFQTASSAGLNILKYSAWLASPKPSDKENAVVAYMTQAQALIYSVNCVSEGMTQDGANRRFICQAGGQKAVLAVDSFGIATFESFSPRNGALV